MVQGFLPKLGGLIIETPESGAIYRTLVMEENFCKVVKLAIPYTSRACIHAKGMLEGTRHGNNGAVFDTDLKIKLNTATRIAAVAANEAEVSTEALSATYAYIDVNAFCEYLNSMSYASKMAA